MAVGREITVYDALLTELARRSKLPLAKSDAGQARVAESTGVKTVLV